MKILGVDLGIASVGWALVDDKSNKIIKHIKTGTGWG
jgi:CRISPR/Cas system Type II protein with McrA/HNH and RuvC-like nuclease domain